MDRLLEDYVLGPPGSLLLRGGPRLRRPAATASGRRARAPGVLLLSATAAALRSSGGFPNAPLRVSPRLSALATGNSDHTTLPLPC